MLTLALNIQPVKAGKVIVPDDFPTIQEAINAANPGDTVYVKTGVYYESVHVNKSLELVGEETNTTIIDGAKSPSESYVVGLDANNIILTGFTVRNGNFGIHLNHMYCLVKECSIRNNTCAILFEWGPSNNIEGNMIWNNTYGVAFTDSSHYNIVRRNTIWNNDMGIYIEHSINLSIYHNDFINNSVQVHIEKYGSNSSWDVDYPSGGNYWSDYAGLDANGDGIGDTPHVIDADNQDRCPLMHTWSSFPVHNINTGLGYATIQEAITAPETLDGHTIFVEAGIYREHVSVNKTINLIGEDRVVTIIDGYEVDVTANNVAVSGFAIGGFTAFAEGKKGNGIRLEADGCTVDNNTIFNASPYGVWLLNSTNNVISNNVMIANDYNVMLTESSNNTISQNYIGSIEWEGGIRLVYGGIELYSSSNNTITQNNVTQCQRAIRMEGVIPPGELQSDSSNNTIIENNVEHWEYGISLSDCSNNTILINNITYLGLWIGKIEDSTGVSLYRSFNNMIIKNNIEHNGEGVRLVDSSFNNITDNNLTENFYGILLQGSQVNSLIGNNVTHDPVTFEESNETSRTGFGILISSYYSNLLRNNTIAGYKYNFGVGSGYGYYFQDVDTSNTVDGKPIYFWSDRQSGQIPSDAGYVAIVNSTNIIVEGLDLKNNYQGILIAYCNDTIIRQNNVANNDYGIWLDSSSNNTIYHNNFTDNGQHAYIDGEYGAGVNVWDDGYPSGGNRWSDYTGTDFYCGPHQNLTGSDGIGDTPYVIDENNQDTYPLGVFSAHLLGDLNQDKIVDILDAVQAASAFGSHAGDPGWNDQADLNQDNIVDIFDIIILANNFGKRSP
jgi:parallel beta-helix repeat protein